jgi:hypothetical protein
MAPYPGALALNFRRSVPGRLLYSGAGPRASEGEILNGTVVLSYLLDYYGQLTDKPVVYRHFVQTDPENVHACKGIFCVSPGS